MKNLIQKIMLGLAIFCGMTIVMAPVVVSAQSANPNKDAVCEGVGLTGGSCNAGTPGPSVDSTISTVINVLSLVVGITAVIMIIIGGFKYIISSGDSSNVNSAKNTILYAIIGLIVVALAQVLVRFVLKKVG